MKLKPRLVHELKNLYLLYKSQRLKGNTFFCPLCDFHAARFLSSPNGQRENVQCPRCLSLERHRAQWLFGNKYLIPGKNRKLRILHFAPDFCLTRKLVKSKNVIYTTADKNSSSCDYRIDIQKLSMGNEMFDVVICNHVLEHVDDDHKAIAEIYRILRNNGILLVQTPVDISRNITFEDPSVVDPQKRAELFGQDDHLRLYGLDFSECLAKAGFRVEVIKFWERLSSEEIRHYAVKEYEPVYICQKIFEEKTCSPAR
jgi:SAM-dependent methyltransferase